MPQFSAFPARWQIAGCTGAWIAEPHRNNRDDAGVVELLSFNSHPLSKSIAAGVIPRNARFVDATTGSLADDQNLGSGLRLKNRTRAKRQVLFALPALTNLSHQHRQFSHESLRLSDARVVKPCIPAVHCEVCFR